MSEPTSTSKAAALAMVLFGVTLPPVLADWSYVLAGAVVGAAAHLSIAPPTELPRWWQPITRFSMSVLVACTFAWVLAAPVAHWLGPQWIPDEQALLAALAAIVAIFWRAAMLAGPRLAMAWINRRIGSGGSGQ